MVCKKQEKWFCDACSKESDDLYFTEDGREICSSCRETKKGEIKSG